MDQKLPLFPWHYTPRQARRTRSVRPPLVWTELNRGLPALHQAKDRFSVCDMVTAWIVPQHLSWDFSPQWDTWETFFHASLEPDFPREPRVCYPTFAGQLQLPKWNNKLLCDLQNDCYALILIHKLTIMHTTDKLEISSWQTKPKQQKCLKYISSDTIEKRLDVIWYIAVWFSI